MVFDSPTNDGFLPPPEPHDKGKCRHCDVHIEALPVPHSGAIYWAATVPQDGVLLPNECPGLPRGETSFGRHEPA
ncbi:hypothetical protein ACIBG7_26930 [Nonomuraea sp. NPDC050328]|uniref:hypothetical protein n=1 Tax=Nonomuraea sp. NPDC050328 TaxID=3364361 RepID=UPI0037A55D91